MKNISQTNALKPLLCAALFAAGSVVPVPAAAGEILKETFASGADWPQQAESQGWTFRSSRPAVDPRKLLYNPDGNGTKGELAMTRPMEGFSEGGAIAVRFTVTISGGKDVENRRAGVGLLADEVNAFGLLVAGVVERVEGVNKARLKLIAPSRPWGQGTWEILFESEPVEGSARALFEMVGIFTPATGVWEFSIDGQPVGRYEASAFLKKRGLSLDRPGLALVFLGTKLNPRIGEVSIAQLP